MTQLTFAEAEYATKKRKKRREVFLEKMDPLIPLKQLEKKLSKHCHKGRTGRPPYLLSTMFRVHCLQLFYNRSDPAMEDALYEIESMRRFAGLRLSECIPDETTFLNFRHFLESRRLDKAIFDTVNNIAERDIIEAPSSTKNRQNARDPEMDQTRKGNQWYFGMKMHIGVDDTLGFIH
jgi:IS5 family transposase